MRALLKAAALLLVFTTACSSCAGKIPSMTESPKPIIDKGVAIFTPDGFGRGCPVNGGIITARHILKKPNEPGFYEAWWSDNFGHDGFSTVKYHTDAVDMAMLMPADFPHPNPVKVGRPTVGENVYWFEYDIKNGLAFAMRRAKLVRRVGGHLILSEGPSMGASGGCLYNQKGEAVGIVVWLLVLEDESTIGIAVQFPKEWI